ncbi:hypothetical protein HELRODRAFT_173054 [Helobdella robusta]|uniref:Uncharacterized protein n=1 Tax=Helobdella robusta TaxID=6412 RepID=T1F6A9_HELRO|nr:hypothetical protein HELRODRAFT_173054 [Helobdella robusta]ESO04002.1 hypothetical protein HELRODRAFT_173054 [Helobdella robusta]
MKQRKLDFDNNTSVSQNKINDLIMKFIVNGLQSSRIFDTQAFKNLVADHERVYCRVADSGQERLRRGEGSGGYSYADAVRDHVVRNSNAARRKFTTLMINAFESSISEKSVLEQGFDNDDDDDTEEDYDKIEIASIENIARDAELDPDVYIILPPYYPCSSHTLSLIAVIDSQKALKENAIFKKLHNSKMAKCSAHLQDQLKVQMLLIKL